MSETHREPGRLWAFAVAVHAREGVASACLTLQDDYGQDVLLLLCAAWAGAERGLAASPEQMSEADAGARAWRDEVIAVLRGLRRRLKPPAGATADPDEAALRAEIKRAELAAERIGLARLETVVAGWKADGPKPGSCGRGRTQSEVRLRDDGGTTARRAGRTSARHHRGRRAPRVGRPGEPGA